MASQVVHLAFAGMALTLGNAASYWALTDVGGLDPMVSLAITSLVSLGAGFVTLGRLTFGNQDGDLAWDVRGIQFFLVRLLGLSIN